MAEIAGLIALIYVFTVVVMLAWVSTSDLRSNGL